MLNTYLLLILLGLSCFTYAQEYDLYPARSKAVKTAPILVFVHGGAWVSGDKSQYKLTADAWTKKGVCFASVNYRLAPAAQHPKPIDDFSEFMKRLSADKTMPNCDHSQLYLIGHSAGAHILSFWATSEQSDKIKGFIGLSGIYDLPKLAKKWPEYPNWFLIKAFGNSSNWPTASPARLTLKNKQKWLVVHSEKDELVDIDQSLDFVAHLKAQKVHVDFLQLQNETHFETVNSLQNTESVLSKKIDSFLKNP